LALAPILTAATGWISGRREEVLWCVIVIEAGLVGAGAFVAVCASRCRVLLQQRMLVCVCVLCSMDTPGEAADACVAAAAGDGGLLEGWRVAAVSAVN
jgi:hypothetical protein